MSSLTFGTLSVNILKAKNLIKIENGTKKNLTIKNPIIKIDYISGTKVSTPAEKQGDEFIWNCKLNFEAIKDKTSFFLQCFNNNTEDNYNLLGETRIPLILAIENENFKQWYPIYLREKKRTKSNFICRGEILINIEFYSVDRIKNDKLDILSLLSDSSTQNEVNSIQIPRNSSLSRSSNSKSSSKLTGFSIVTSEDASEIPRQPPKILPRSVRNMGYRNNGIRKYKKEEEENGSNVLYEDMEVDDPIYNDAYFHEKYNDSYIYPNDVNDLANQSFTYSTFLKNKQQKMASSKSAKPLKRSNSINNAKLERNKLIHRNSLPTFKDLNKGLHYRNGSLPRKYTSKERIPIQALSTPPTTVFNTSSLRFYKGNHSIGSDINTLITNSDNTTQSIPLSALPDQNSNYERNGVNKACPSNNIGNYSVINSIDENGHNNILPSQSTSSEFDLFHNNSFLSDNDLLSFQNVSLPPSILSSNNGNKETSILIGTSQNKIMNPNNSISLNEMTSEEKDFILKMNAKYKKNMIVIDDNEDKIVDIPISTSTPTPSPPPSPTPSPMPSSIPATTTITSSSMEYSRPKKRALNIFKNIFHPKSKKKCSKKKMENNKIKTTLKREKSVVSMKDTKTGKIYTTTTTTVTTVTRSSNSSSLRKLRKKGSNISRKSLKKLNQSMERNKERIRVARKESRQPLNDITNSGGLKRKNAVRYSKRYSSQFSITNAYPQPPSNNENNKSNDDSSNEMNESSSTLNRIIEPYHHMGVPNTMDKTNNLKKENKENSIQSRPFIPERKDSHVFTSLLDTNKQNYDVFSNPEIIKPSEVQMNNTTVNTSMIMYNEPLSQSETSNEQEMKMNVESSDHKYKTIAQIINERNSQRDQHKGKEPEMMDIDSSVQSNSILNSTIEEIKNDMKTRTLPQTINNNDSIIIDQDCPPQENIHKDKEVIDIPDQTQYLTITPELMEILKEPLLTSSHGMTEQQLQEYNKQMIQKLQYQQLSQRLALSFKHYNQYQDLLQQFNENKHPYNQLPIMKDQLYRQQQSQIRLLNKRHAQQRSELQQYLFNLQ